MGTATIVTTGEVKATQDGEKDRQCAPLGNVGAQFRGAISVFSEWTFERFKHVLRLEAEVYEGNESSARVLERAGYKFEANNRNAIEKMGVVMSVLVYCKFRHGY